VSGRSYPPPTAATYRGNAFYNEGYLGDRYPGNESHGDSFDDRSLNMSLAQNALSITPRLGGATSDISARRSGLIPPRPQVSSDSGGYHASGESSHVNRDRPQISGSSAETTSSAVGGGTRTKRPRPKPKELAI
jgi:hypothetical protein